MSLRCEACGVVPADSYEYPYQIEGEDPEDGYAPLNLCATLCGSCYSRVQNFGVVDHQVDGFTLYEGEHHYRFIFYTESEARLLFLNELLHQQ